MDTIKPALTADEWADPSGAHLIRKQREDWSGGEPGAEPSYYPTRHGIAAINLHGRPFGFTWRDVDELRFFSSTLMSKQGAPESGGSSFAQWCDSLADRIEALLPPRQETP